MDTHYTHTEVSKRVFSLVALLLITLFNVILRASR